MAQLRCGAVALAILLLFIPWQAAAVALAGAGLTALALKPPRERLVIRLAALYVACSAQGLFTASAS